MSGINHQRCPSEQDRWQPGTQGLLVAADGHQVTLLDDPQSVGEAPPEELPIPARYEDAEAQKAFREALVEGIDWADITPSRRRQWAGLVRRL